MTRRCLESDLRLSPDLVSTDARDFSVEHSVLRKTCSVRGPQPDGGEVIKSLTPSGAYRSLHDGRARGATLWVEDEDVCWLVAYDAYHATGDRNDVYNYFVKLQEAGKLAPTEADWLALTESTPVDLLEQLRERAADLIAEARGTPGREAMITFQGNRPEGRPGEAVMAIDLVVVEDDGAEQGWLGVTLPRDVDWPAEGVLAVFAALLPPEVRTEDLTMTNRFASRDSRKGEIVCTWSQYF